MSSLGALLPGLALAATVAATALGAAAGASTAATALGGGAALVHAAAGLLEDARRRALVRFVAALALLVLAADASPLDLSAVARAGAVAGRAAALWLSLVGLARALEPSDRARIAAALARGRAIHWLRAGAIVGALALSAREASLIAHLPQLGPDAMLFHDLAAKGGPLFEGGMREPLHVWVLRLAFAVFGDSYGVMQGVSVALSLTALLVFERVTRALTGSPVFAGLATLLLGLSRFQAAMSVTGLRYEETTIGLLLVVWLARRAAEPGARLRDGALAGLAAGGLGLVYLSSFAVSLAWILGSLALSSLPRRGAAARGALSVGVTFLVLAPHLAANRREHGDAFHAANIHASFYRSFEEAARAGTPEAWTAFERAPYGGPRTTGLALLLDRPKGELAASVGRGLGRLATYRSPAFDAYRPVELGFFVWLGALGGLAALALDPARRSLAWIPALVALLPAPILFLVGSPLAGSGPGARVFWLEQRFTNQHLFAWLWLLFPLYRALVREPDAAASREPSPSA